MGWRDELARRVREVTANWPIGGPEVEIVVSFGPDEPVDLREAMMLISRCNDREFCGARSERLLFHAYATQRDGAGGLSGTLSFLLGLHPWTWIYAPGGASVHPPANFDLIDHPSPNISSISSSEPIGIPPA